MREIDLKKEQESSLARDTYKYTFTSKMFFMSMNMVAGKKDTLSKIVLIELLASIPYRAWELRMYSKLTFGYKNRQTVEKALKIMEWSRDAQDNEYWHVLAAEEKIKADKAKRAWYLTPPIPFFMIAFYIALTRTMALFNLRSAFIFNAQFEDHAEHVYAQFVKDHPEMENQPVNSDIVLERMPFDSWADVFRRIGLDERDHRNKSFEEAGMPEHIVHYEGEPESHDEA